MAETASLHRSVTEQHVCPFGVKAKDLLEREGFEVEDHVLSTKEEVEAFKEEWGVETTPQVFIEGERIGGYDDLREHLGKEPESQEDTTYQPVVALFCVTFLMAAGSTWASFGTLLEVSLVERFVAFSMIVLGLLKLQDLTSFANRFLGYDLVARRFVRYAYVYPFAETLAGLLMLAGLLDLLAGALALTIGSIGAVSVAKAVYVEKRELECACVGGDSRVPLGFLSLTENVMMVLMGTWMIVR